MKILFFVCVTKTLQVLFPAAFIVQQISIVRGHCRLRVVPIESETRARVKINPRKKGEALAVREKTLTAASRLSRVGRFS